MVTETKRRLLITTLVGLELEGKRCDLNIPELFSLMIMFAEHGPSLLPFAGCAHSGDSGFCEPADALQPPTANVSPCNDGNDTSSPR